MSKLAKEIEEYANILVKNDGEEGLILFLNYCERCDTKFSTIEIVYGIWHRYVDKHKTIRCPNCGNIIDIKHERSRM